MKSVFQFILSHSIFIAFCASALSLQTLQLLLLPISTYLLVFIFFAALSAYNAYWILSSYSFNKTIPLRTFFQHKKSSFLVLLLAIIGMLYCYTRLNLVMYNLVIAAVLLGAYSLPVMPFKLPLLLRRAGVFKTIILAFSWTIITTLIPLQTSLLDLDQTARMVFMNHFLLMLMLCLIFDKRDAVVDKMRGLQSLATAIRPRMIHYLFGLFFIGYLVVSYSLNAYQVTILQVLALILAGVATLIVYIASLQKRGYLFYYFLVDGLMFFSALLTGLASI